MITQGTLHQRLQEYCDCYAEADVEFELGHMSRPDTIPVEGDMTELALRYLALALLTAIEGRAEVLVIARWASRLIGREQCLLATPSDGIVTRAIEIVKQIAGVDRQLPCRRLVLGLRNDHLVLDVEHRVAGREEEILFALPDLMS